MRVKEGLCTMEDAQSDSTMEDVQSEAGFGGQLRNVVCPRKIMADGEAQKFV